MTQQRDRLSVQVVGDQVASNRNFPLVTVGQELLLVVEKLFVSLRRELEVRALHNGIDRTGLLAETAVNALGHVNIVTSRTTSAVIAQLSLNGDGL